VTSRRADALAWSAVASAALAFAACLAGWLAGGGAVEVAWAPTLGLRLDLAFDGLAALYCLLATGIGVLVFAYGAGYLPWHLEHAGRPPSDVWRFWPWMVFFMGSMVGLACARDLVLLFVFFDLTAVASYFLIGFDRDRDARGAALMALLVTGVSAVAMLVAAVLLYDAYGTFSLTELFERAGAGTTTTVAGALIAIAALAKSAQAPLHFWLPRAMAAPTPVSAYLHSAAMVAAGVLVLGRVHPLLEKSDLVLDGLLVVGLVSIAVGGVLALAQDELKQILAHSTISQYGYVVTLYGIGGATAAGAAALYVLAHAIAKSALFMTAGAITVTTGEMRLSQLGGLGRRLPALAVASAIAAATLAALPLTLGFFKDELFFSAASEHGRLVQGLAVAAAALTVAYIGRFWLGLFTGPLRAKPSGRVPWPLLGPVAFLGALALVGGLVVEPFARLAEDAAAVTHAGALDVAPAYHLDAGSANVMALAAWGLGALVLLAPRARAPLVRTFARVGERAGPRRWYALSLLGLNRLSDWAHDKEVRDLRNSIAAVLVPAAALIALAFAVTPTRGSYTVGGVEADDLPIVVLLGLGALAAVTAARDTGRLRPVLALSVLGFALAGVYAVAGAPDVALVAVLVETVLTLVFVGVFARLPPAALRRPRLRARNAVIAAAGGAAAFAAIWGALSRPTAAEGVAAEHIEQAPRAHGGDVVTVILADFRGLDTMVEITVLAVAVVGVASLLSRGRAW
jgi:multicomponent Na+:H+ antiporter subunit A